MAIKRPCLEHLKRIVSDLVTCKFDEIGRRGQLGKHAKGDLKRELDEYPGQICMPPDHAFETVEWIELGENAKADFVGEINLWYDDEMSDLVLTVSFFINEIGEADAEIGMLVVM